MVKHIRAAICHITLQRISATLIMKHIRAAICHTTLQLISAILTAKHIRATINPITLQRISAQGLRAILKLLNAVAGKDMTLKRSSVLALRFTANAGATTIILQTKDAIVIVL
jgi:hypothetical protein